MTEGTRDALVFLCIKQAMMSDSHAVVLFFLAASVLFACGRDVLKIQGVCSQHFAVCFANSRWDRLREHSKAS